MKNFLPKISTFLLLILIPSFTIEFSEDERKTDVVCYLKLKTMTCTHPMSSSKTRFNFSEIPDAAEILHIDCKDQLVDFLPPDGFMNLTNLSYLEIVNCLSLRSRENLFLSQQNLEDLILKKNALTDDIFRELKPSNLLGLLDLSLNEIETLDFEFGIFPNLHQLILAGNFIHHISSNSFKNCFRLMHISLAFNSISTLINTNEFGNFTNIFDSEHLPNLKFLNLKDNAIHRMDWGMIPKTVEILTIFYNSEQLYSCNESHLRNHTLKTLVADWSLVDNSIVCLPPLLETLLLYKIKPSRFSQKLVSVLINLQKGQVNGSNSFVAEIFVPSSSDIVFSGVNILLNAECSKARIRNLPGLKDIVKYCYNPPKQEIKTIPVHNKNSSVLCQFIQICFREEYYDLYRKYCSVMPEIPELSIPLTYSRAPIIDCGNLMLNKVPLKLPNNSMALYLDGNNLTSINLQQILEDFPYLEALYLNRSNIHQIEVNKIKKISSPLQELHLENNFLNYFPVTLLKDLENLTSLHLENNSLTEFHIVFAFNLDLDLHLEYNNISNFFIAENVTLLLTYIYLQYNMIYKIKEIFCNFCNTLYLDNNEISEVELDCSNIQTSSKLQYLFLRNNLLTVLKSFSFSNLINLMDLHLEGNRIEHLEENCFHDLPKLQGLFLQRNKIKTISKEMLLPLNQVEELYNHFYLYRWYFSSSHLRTKERSVNLTKTGILYENYLRYLTFKIDLGKNFIERIDLSVFNIFPFLLSIQLNNNNLREINCDQPLSLPFLKEIYLEENRLASLNGEVFKGLTKVTKLYLHQNDLVFINKDTFKDMTSLQILTLNGNKFQRLDILQFRFSSNFKQLTIHGNPISCDCKYLDELRDIFKKVNFISNVSEVKCLSKENKNYSLEDYLFQFCDNKQMIIGLSVSIGVLLFTVFISLLVYKYRLEIRVILYSRFRVRFFHNQAMDEGKPFHAFVAYSCDDGEFVANQLLPHLEEYRLCLHDRNFVVGAFIQDNIVNAINYSACTVIIFSRSFVKSPWCRFEFRTAHDKSLHKGCRPIIVIVLEDVPPDDMEEEMKVYLRTSTYLRWGDKLFWEKLYFVLPTVNGNDNERNNQQEIPLLLLNR